MLAGSMNAASTILNVSQPAISRSIALSEQRLGYRLFDRRRGKLVPTREAHLLFDEVTRLHEVAQQVERFAEDLGRRSSGQLSVCASPSLALGFIPGVIAAYLRRHPGVQIRYRTAALSDMAHELVTRQADLAISVLPVQDDNLEVTTLAEADMVCVLPRGHGLLARQSLGLEELSSHPLIGYDRTIPFGRLTWQAFSRAGLVPRLVAEVPRAELALALVREGVGYALLDRFTLSHMALPDLEMRPLQHSIPVSISLLRSRYRTPNAHVDAFSELLRQAARADQTVRSSSLWLRRAGQDAGQEEGVAPPLAEAPLTRGG